jgi:hypothetical protein
LYLSDKVTTVDVDSKVAEFHDILWDEEDRSLMDAVDEFEGLADPSSILEDTGGIDIGLEPVSGSTGVTKPKRRVRRGGAGRIRFVRYWVDWGKVKFPTVAGTKKAADRDCVARALVREMETMHVRYSDIAKYKDRILLGILMPSKDEVNVAQAMATEVARGWQDATQGWRWKRPRTWWEWWCGKESSLREGASYRVVP